MRRLCIYVIYDKQQKINPYIGTVLCELRKFATDIIVVCNFDKIAEGEEYIYPYATDVYFRDNIGFDAGAYKDALINFVTWNKALSYDELLLTNDTYFGPIYPFDKMFIQMDNKQCDFWGITRHPKVHIEGIGDFEEHIQSFFLNLKAQVFHSKYFRRFWDEYEYMDDKERTIVNFEIGINTYLSGNGFKACAYMDDCHLPFMEKTNINPYSRFAYELISEAKVPIIKKTNFYGKNRWLINTFMAMEYIEQNTDYDTSLIKNYIFEYQRKGLIGPYFDFKAMGEFVAEHSKKYIYGCGIWGQITADYFKKMGWEYECFLVTENINVNIKPDADIRLFSDVAIGENDGIIIAQEYKDVCEKIIQYIGERCGKGQIFTPCYN